MSAALLLLGLAAWQEAARPAPPRAVHAAPSEEELAGHKHLLELLEGVRRRTPRTNPFLGDFQLKQLSESRAGMDERTTSPKTLAKLEHDFGRNYLRLGRTEEALASFRACYERLQSVPREDWPPFAERLSFDLGVAAMRKGEADNCVARHTAQSCLLPIEAGGVHTEPAGSREALRWLREARETTRDFEVALSAKWLLNIAAMTLGEYPQGLTADELIAPQVFAAEAEFPRFPDLAPALGLNRSDLAGGAILEDFDGDGRVDVFTSTSDPSEALHYNQNRGDGSFEDLSQEANLGGLFGGLNLLSGDYDGDGWTDVFVLRGAWLAGERGQIPKSLLQNRNGRSFLDVTQRAGLNEVTYPSQAAGFADYDLDGDLDLYVGSEALPDDPFPGLLYQNQGNGTFRDVARAAGVENQRFCKGVTWGDFDGDRYPDLYASNQGNRNRLYRNRRDGTFEDVAEKLGLTLPKNSFATWFWDFDNDGALDLYVTSYELVDPQSSLRIGPVVAGYLGIPYGELPCLYRGDGRGGFSEVARQQNLQRVTLPMGANFGDLDNDGFLDFYLGTGYPAYDGLVPNVLYWNQKGEKFLDVSAAAGMGHLQKGHAVAFGDLDDDGDQEVFEQLGGAFPGDGFGDVLFSNPGFGNHWLKLQLVGVQSNRSAFGTRIHAEFEEHGARRHVWRWVGTGGSFGCNPLTQHLGLGRAERVARLEIYWPKSDTTQVFTDVPVDAKLEIVEGQHEFSMITPRPIAFAVQR